MASSINEVIVTGGGIGGLCTAIGLHNPGINVAVYKQTSELKAVGAGLTRLGTHTEPGSRCVWDRAKILFSVELRFVCAAGARAKGLCTSAST